MKDILQDIVAHTHQLGFLSIVKVTNDKKTVIESMAEDRSVILIAESHKKVDEFTGTFGMPNLEKLALHLKNPEYKENANIEVVISERNGEDIPTHIHFENAAGDFENDYKFMNKAIIEEKLKSIKFKGANWNISFSPSLNSIARMKLMSAAHTEESLFTVKVENNNLVFYFGNSSTHAGSFIFKSNVVGSLKNTLTWPISQVQSILNLDGDLTISISDQGAMQITVDSGLINYNYILPAKSK